MKKIPFIARIILGLMFFVFGLNGFFHFIPMPAMPERDMAVMNGFKSMEYFLPLLSGCQVLCGFLLLVGAFVPLALIILAPIVSNIVLYHVYVNRSGLVMALIIAAITAYLAFFADPYRKVVRQIFK